LAIKRTLRRIKALFSKAAVRRLSRVIVFHPA
jgi:hypothetical protein